MNNVSKYHGYGHYINALLVVIVSEADYRLTSKRF